jgi:hypothetical protein
MKYIITERQYNLIEQKKEILTLPFAAFSDDWWLLQKYIDRKGNPPYELTGDVNLYNFDLETLGTLVKVDGNLDLYDTPIKSLGDLEYVGGYLDLGRSDINSLGKLKYVGSYLNIDKTPLLDEYTGTEIMQMVRIKGSIYV